MIIVVSIKFKVQIYRLDVIALFWKWKNIFLQRYEFFRCDETIDLVMIIRIWEKIEQFDIYRWF